MAWYNDGTIAVTGGSAAVVGTGTAFVENVKIGDALRGPDERLYQIASVNSATSLTLTRNYGGATAAGQTYEIVPLQDAMAVLARNVAALIEDYQDIADNAGQGMFGDGSVGTPGMRFANDQDTGMWRPSANAIAIATGGVDRIRVDANGNVGVGAPPSAGVRMYVRPATIDGIPYYADNGTNSGFKVAFGSGLTTVGNDFGAALALQTNNAERMRIDANGRLGIGTAAPGDKVDVRFTGSQGVRVVSDDGNSAYLSLVSLGHIGWSLTSQADGALAFGADGNERLRISSSGNLSVGTTDVGGWRTRIAAAGTNILSLYNSTGMGVKIGMADQGWAAEIEQVAGALIFKAGGATERARIDTSGNLLVGAAGGSSHVIFKTLTAQTDKVLDIGYDNATPSMRVFGAYAGLGSSAHCAANFGHSSTTSRSINAGGTINASGADYAEYMIKATGCGIIAKGDVCGVDIEGKLTQSWAAAHSFVIKSTDPSLVGGDSWASGLDPRPEAPSPIGAAPVAPIPPEPFTESMPTQQEGEEQDAFQRRLAEFYARANAAAAAEVTYQQEAAAFADQVAAWESASATYAADLAQYEIDLAAWEAALEAERLKVDRIAFCGQVPANLIGQFAVGDYVVPAEGDGDSITAIAVPESTITFEQYRRRIGKVWAIREGRAWIDVQHG